MKEVVSAQMVLNAGANTLNGLMRKVQLTEKVLRMILLGSSGKDHFGAFLNKSKRLLKSGMASSTQNGASKLSSGNKQKYGHWQ